MTEEEFFEKLELVPTDVVVSYSQLRVGRISGSLCYCPITYVAHKHLGLYFGTSGARLAGSNLGLVHEFVGDIMSAADYEHDTILKRPRLLELHNKIRKAWKIPELLP